MCVCALAVVMEHVYSHVLNPLDHVGIGVQALESSDRCSHPTHETQHMRVGGRHVAPRIMTSESKGLMNQGTWLPCAITSWAPGGDP